MTVTVRVEKADATYGLVMVQEQITNEHGIWVDVGSPRVLSHAAELQEFYIYSTKRLIVSEQQLGD